MSDISKCFISESKIDGVLWDILEAYDKFDKKEVNAYIYCFNAWDEENFEDRRQGQYSSPKRLAEDLLEDIVNDIPDCLRGYIDYDGYGRDLILGGDFTEHNDWYFRTT